ncbi:MAG: sigma-70 family RNA polymerase sigma factor [Thermoanaerobaculia bacterium]|nr:sigma-70 family RNA polymerase sigma factor [Thermoanaerobaculia bacterium]
MPIDSMAELVRRCARERDPRLWEEFVRAFGTRLKGGVRRALRRSGGAVRDEELDDLLQDVYCKLLENGARSLVLCRAADGREAGAYLGRVAETVVLDRLRAAAAAKRGRDLLVTPPAHVEADPAERAVDSSARSPEERLLNRERRRIFLLRCRDAAGPRDPRRDLKILYLAFLEGMTSREIARRLGPGLTPGSVDSLVHRAKRRLARLGVALPHRRERV